MKSVLFTNAITDVAEIPTHLYNLVQNGLVDGHAYVGLPELPISDLAQLRAAFAKLANADSLDLTVFIYSNDQVDQMWDLGWDDGRSIHVHIYGREHFVTDAGWRKFIDVIE